MKKHYLSFKNAFSGLVLAFKTQPNYKIHFALSAFALWGSWFFDLSYFEFLIVLLFIFLGLTIEMVNTAVEATCDAIDTNHREDIRIAKDVSAAAMLIFSIGAFIIGCIIFIPKIINFIS
jgi:diacylglycerol kinase